MQKFDEWNEEKKSLETKDKPKFFVKSREIWLIKMGQNIGFEQSGNNGFKRPVLVLKKIGSIFFTLALTTQKKPKNTEYYWELKTAWFSTPYEKPGQLSFGILSQVRVIDKKRFIARMGKISTKEFNAIKEKLKDTLL